jgi:type II secretion system protein N
MKVDVGLLGFIGGKASIDFEAVFGEGLVHGNISASSGETALHIVGEDVPSELLPMREVLSNLPMSGVVAFELSFELPNEKLKSGKVGPNWERLAAELDFECPSGCTIGDGKSKLKLKAKNARSQAFAGDGTDFGRINIQSLVARLEAKDGKVDITKFETRSADVELHVEYSMTLQQNLDDSPVAGCVRFKGSDALKKREQKTYDQILLTGAKRHTDGLDHIRLTGTFKNMLKRPEACGPGVSGIDGDGQNSRPNLQVQPDEPIRRQPPPQPVNPPPTPIDAGVMHLDASDQLPHAGSAATGSAGSGSGSGQFDGHGSGSGSGSAFDAAGSAVPPP